MAASKIAKTSNKRQKCPIGRRDHVKSINHTSTEASDAGVSLIELIISTVIAGILLISVAGLIGMAIRTFGTRDGSTSNPHRITQHALARTAERMMIAEECANPSTATNHTECLERAEISFPKPVIVGKRPAEYDNPPYSGTGLTTPNACTDAGGDWNTTTSTCSGASHNVLCWVVDSRDTDDNHRRPSTFTNKDFRDLECWGHDPAKGTITAHIHHPDAKTGDTSTEYEPAWDDDLYRSTHITNGIERLGYCTRSNGSVIGIKEETACTTGGHTWNDPWGCVAGIDTDPRSGVNTANAVSAVQEEPCTNAFTDGVAVLILRVCVSMTPAELERRSSDDNQWADHPLTCNGRNTVVTPGRK